MSVETEFDAYLNKKDDESTSLFNFRKDLLRLFEDKLILYMPNFKFPE